MKKYTNISANEKRLFQVAVISTMSSGKSTLINAIIGQEMLPSLNQACTARTLSILDKDGLPAPQAHILYEDGTYKCINSCTADIIRQYNSDQNEHIRNILVMCDVPAVHNASTALMLVDTPGVNNNNNSIHQSVTMDFINSMESGLLLYLINATQIGTTDDALFLNEIVDVLHRNPRLHILFVVNKIDELDFQKEAPAEAIDHVAAYLIHHGIESPDIHTVSSTSALVMKKALQGALSEEMELYDFESCYRRFKRHMPDFYDYRQLTWSEEVNATQAVLVDGTPYSTRELYTMLEMTGIPMLERKIEQLMLENTKPRQPRIRKI